MSFDIREKMAISTGVCLLTILLWYVFFYTPKRNALKRIKEEQRLIQTQYDQLLENSSHMMFESAKKLEVSKKCMAILDNLPYKEDIASALSLIMDVAQGKDIRIISISPNKLSFSENHDSELEKMAFDMTMEGGYLNICRYLFDLIDLPFFIGYGNIDIESSREIYPETKAQMTCILLFLSNSEQESKNYEE